MKQEVKVSFYLKRNETKKDGKSPVMARLSIGKFSETIFSAKMTVPADLWASGRVKLTFVTDKNVFSILFFT